MSTTLLLSFKGRRKVVLKIAPHRVVPEYEQEAYQLNYLRDLGLPTPEVYACTVGHLDQPHSFLLMEYMPGIPFTQAKELCSEDEFNHLQMHLADLVLTMHSQTNRSYTRVDDGHNEGTKSFPEFFRSVYDPILEDVTKMKHMSIGLRRRIGAIHDRLDKVLEHDDRPRLIHGDLWGANLLAQKDAKGKWWVSALLDPNCRFSHSEIEIAYLDLFRTTTPAFFRAYKQSHRLDEDYHERRKHVYQMYPLLNHVRLFGAKYIQPLEAAALRVATVTAKRKAS